VVADVLDLERRGSKNKAILEHPELLLTHPDHPKLEFKVAIMRDPVERLISCWRSKIGHFGPRETGGLLKNRPDRYSGMSFSAFVDTVLDCRDETHHTMAQVKFLSADMDFIGHVETLAIDWKRLQSRFPWLPDVGVHGASRVPYPQVSKALRARIALLYEEDCEFLGK
jgi:hypothetical protein